MSEAKTAAVVETNSTVSVPEQVPQAAPSTPPEPVIAQEPPKEEAQKEEQTPTPPLDKAELLRRASEEFPDPKSKDDGAPPKGLWVTGTKRIQAEVLAYKNVTNGELEFVVMPHAKLTEEKKRVLQLVEFPVKAVFSMPTRSQLEHYRERASRWDNNAGDMIISRFRLRRQLIRYHLLDIDLPDPQTNEKVKITRDKMGRLLKSVEKMLLSMHPTVLDLLMVRYEMEANLVY